MTLDPSLVVKTLGEKFGPCHIQRLLNRKEQKIFEHFYRILKDAIYDDLVIESDEEIEEENEIDVADEDWNGDDSNFHQPISSPTLRFDNFSGSEEEKKAALTYHRSSQSGYRTLSSMTNRFRWVKTQQHIQRLREYEKTQSQKVNRLAQLRKIKELLEEKVTKKLNEGISMHEKPVDICFKVDNRMCKAMNCSSYAFMCCAKCSIGLCFTHFIDCCHVC